MEPPLAFGASEFDDLIGRLREATLDRYEIHSKLGHGGMALVVAAKDLSLGRDVAIKILLSQDTAPEAIERFDREARLSASLSHPNIVPIYSIEHYEDIRFFVMKYVRGQSFDAALRRDGAQSPELVQIILEDIGSALDHAHSRGVVHRDLKPANIMLDHGGWAMLMDFGIAKAEEYPSLTHTGFMVGTPAYLAPEYFSYGVYDAKADQYAMGIVLFELLTNRKPFMATSPAALMKSHLLDPPPDLALLRGDCPTELVAVISRLMAKDPADRFASFKDAAAMLRPLPAEGQASARIHMKELAARGAEYQPKMAESQAAATPRKLLRPKTGGIAVVAPSNEDVQVAASGSTKIEKTGTQTLSYRSALWAAAGAAVVFLLITLLRQPVPLPPRTDDSLNVVAQKAETGSETKSVSTQPSGAKTPAKSNASGNQEPPQTRKMADAPVATIGSRQTAGAAETTKAPAVIAEPPLAIPAPASPPATAAETTAAIQPSGKGWVSIGSKKPTAALYSNGKLISVLSPQLKTIAVDAGTVSLEIRADGCATPWKQSVKVRSGDTVFLKFLSPTACDSILFP